MRRVGGVISAGASILFLVSPVFAVDKTTPPSENISASGNISACPEGQFSVICKLGAGEFGKTLGSLTNFIFFAALVLGLVFLIYGGIKWLTSGGDKTGVEEARNHITAAIIGLVIIFLAYLIINVISFFFFGQPISNIAIPNLGL